jgi:predicted enzyme related to lactoylglutathione lyase
MKRVTGIGGIFFKAKNPEKLSKWYQKHLGLNLEEWGGAVFRWSDDPSAENGITVWSAFKNDTDYFEPSSSSFMVNFRVADLNGLLEALRDEGCHVLDRREDSEMGKFGYVIDPEGNNVELWEPPKGM